MGQVLHLLDLVLSLGNRLDQTKNVGNEEGLLLPIDLRFDYLRLQLQFLKIKGRSFNKGSLFVRNLQGVLV